jgi:hypothetical protein
MRMGLLGFVGFVVGFAGFVGFVKLVGLAEFVELVDGDVLAVLTAEARPAATTAAIILASNVVSLELSHDSLHHVSQIDGSLGVSIGQGQ